MQDPGPDPATVAAAVPTEEIKAAQDSQTECSRDVPEPLPFSTEAPICILNGRPIRRLKLSDHHCTIGMAVCAPEKRKVSRIARLGCVRSRRLKSTFLAFMRSLLMHAANRSRGIYINLAAEDIIDAWHRQRGKCALTGVPMSYTYSRAIPDAIWRNASLDRIDSKGYYTPDNIQLGCLVINWMKWDQPEESFRWGATRTRGRAGY